MVRWIPHGIIGEQSSYRPGRPWRLLERQPEFYSFCHTKAQYEEIGPSICRRYQIFGSAT